MMLTKEMLSYIEENTEDIKQIIRDLCAIPAPSHHEEKRAEYCRAWFRANGFENVQIDEALNVVCRYQVTDENDLVVFMAHTDTVFPDTEPMPFREDEKKMYAPGVCDDTANLAVLMVCARYFVQRKLRALGYYAGWPDGVYGEGTARAVSAARRALSLPPGEVDWAFYHAIGLTLFE